VCVQTITTDAFRPHKYSDDANEAPELAVNMGVFLTLWLEETARFCMHHNDGETLAAVFRMCWPVHCGTDGQGGYSHQYELISLMTKILCLRLTPAWKAPSLLVGSRCSLAHSCMLVLLTPACHPPAGGFS
jgi:hypothetical protein